MKSKTETILVVMNVFAWIAFIGLLVKAGILLTTYSIGLVKPEMAGKLYEGKNVENLLQLSPGYYVAATSLLFALVALKARIAYLLIQVLSKIKITKPFTEEVSKMLERISYYILALWWLAWVHNGYFKWLGKQVEGLQIHLVSDEFIFLAGVVFVFAQVFKRGVQLQSESELTV